MSSCATVLVLATEDWFVASHFLPLLRSLVNSGYDVRVATNVHTHRSVIESTGARIVEFDFERSNTRPLHDAAIAARLRRLISAMQPDVVHAIALKPITLVASLFLALKVKKVVLHLTGLGFAGTTRSPRYRLIQGAVLRLLALTLRSKRTHLIVENTHDLNRLSALTHIPSDRVTILGGAGVNPDIFRPAPLPDTTPMQIGYVGRMVWSKGVDTLIAAHEKLMRSGHLAELHLCGVPDAENPKAETFSTLQAWSNRSNVRWYGSVTNVSSFWQGMGVAVVPSRGGEGLPRALLEAAACGRPLIVSDVPGCNDFVRHEIEGLIVPPEDIDALAGAIARLANDRDLAERLSAAARQRVLSGYTERHVETAIRELYARLAPQPRTG